MKYCVVYALLDPRTGSVRYVGSTTVERSQRRVKEHVWRAKAGRTNTHSARWLRQLSALGLKPDCVELERCDETCVMSRETGWIAEMSRRGEPLTNHTKTGTISGYKLTAADRKKLSAALRGKPKSSTHRDNLSAAKCGTSASLATRMKMSATRRGRTLSPEHVAKVASFHTGRKRSEMTKAKMRIAAASRRLRLSDVAQQRKEKRCSKCGRTKKMGAFYCDPRMLDGRTSACKECRDETKCVRRLHNGQNSV